MTPFRLVIVAGCLMVFLGGGFLSYFGVGAASADRTAAAAALGPSARTGSGGGGYGFAGRVK